MGVNKKYAEYYGDEEEEEEKEPMMKEEGEDKPEEMAAEWVTIGIQNYSLKSIDNKYI